MLAHGCSVVTAATAGGQGNRRRSMAGKRKANKPEKQVVPVAEPSAQPSKKSKKTFVCVICNGSIQASSCQCFRGLIVCSLT